MLKWNISMHKRNISCCMEDNLKFIFSWMVISYNNKQWLDKKYWSKNEKLFKMDFKLSVLFIKSMFSIIESHYLIK